MFKMMVIWLLIVGQSALSSFELVYLEDVYEEAYESEAIVRFENNKIYLNQGCVFRLSAYLLLNMGQGVYAILPPVYVDDAGYFVYGEAGEKDVPEEIISL